METLRRLKYLSLPGGRTQPEPSFYSFTLQTSGVASCSQRGLAFGHFVASASAPVKSVSALQVVSHPCPALRHSVWLVNSLAAVPKSEDASWSAASLPRLSSTAAMAPAMASRTTMMMTVCRAMPRSSKRGTRRAGSAVSVSVWSECGGGVVCVDNEVSLFLVVGDSLVGDSLVGDSLVGDSLVGDSLVGDSLVGDSLVGDSLVGDSLSNLRKSRERLAGPQLFAPVSWPSGPVNRSTLLGSRTESRAGFGAATGPAGRPELRLCRLGGGRPPSRW